MYAPRNGLQELARLPARGSGMVRIVAAYEPAKPADGHRVLVDRLWPRGVSKERAHLDESLKDIAPSDALRKWFGHDPRRWAEFRERYLRELDAPAAQALLDGLARRAEPHGHARLRRARRAAQRRRRPGRGARASNGAFEVTDLAGSATLGGHGPDRSEDEAAILVANAAFYRAFSKGDYAAMSALWAERRDGGCFHPTAPAILGRDAVLESWRQILRSAAVGRHALRPARRVPRGGPRSSPATRATGSTRRTSPRRTCSSSKTAAGAWSTTTPGRSPLRSPKPATYSAVN